MALSSENVVVVYCLGDLASEDFADHYVSRHSLDASQKIGVPCTPNKEILDDEATFNSEILTPLKTAIDALESGGRPIHAVVLGFGVPGGFRDGDDIISSTARVSRIHHSFSKKLRNDLFDRKTFKLFDATDAQFAIVAARIDAPKLTIAKEMVDKGAELERQFFANGTFYIDPYSDRHGPFAQEYENSILNFQARTLPKLNLNSFSTIFLDPYVDVIIPAVEDDSFVWSWFTDRGASTFFKDTNAARIFFYNADFDGAETVRNVAERRWPILAIQNGYFSTAGAMSDPTIEGFLDPTAFFETILNGGTIGEAYMFSVPFLDWTMTFFGDPLVLFSFPTQDILTIELNVEEAIRLMSIDLARSIARYIRRSDLIEQARNTVVFSEDIDTEVPLLLPIENLSRINALSRANTIYARVSNELFAYGENVLRNRDKDNPQPTFDDLLTQAGFQVSELVVNAVSNNLQTISDSNILPQGQWQLEVPILDEVGSFAFYHFVLQVSDQSDFSNILLTVDSSLDNTNWEFEKEVNEFEQVEPIGVKSNFAGRRVRYTSKSDEFLPRAQVFYFRIRQEVNAIPFAFREFEEIIYT